MFIDFLSLVEGVDVELHLLEVPMDDLVLGTAAEGDQKLGVGCLSAVEGE